MRMKEGAKQKNQVDDKILCRSNYRSKTIEKRAQVPYSVYAESLTSSLESHSGS
jgi:hypothetical protein